MQANTTTTRATLRKTSVLSAQGKMIGWDQSSPSSNNSSSLCFTPDLSQFSELFQTDSSTLQLLKQCTPTQTQATPLDTLFLPLQNSCQTANLAQEAVVDTSMPLSISTENFFDFLDESAFSTEQVASSLFQTDLSSSVALAAVAALSDSAYGGSPNMQVASPSLFSPFADASLVSSPLLFSPSSDDSVSMTRTISNASTNSTVTVAADQEVAQTTAKSTASSTRVGKKRRESTMSHQELVNAIEDKRKRNTESAARSRARKMQKMNELETIVDGLRAENDKLRALLASHGIAF